MIWIVKGIVLTFAIIHLAYIFLKWLQASHDINKRKFISFLFQIFVKIKYFCSQFEI